MDNSYIAGLTENKTTTRILTTSISLTKAFIKYAISRILLNLLFKLQLLMCYHSQQVFLKNLPPNSSLIEEIMDRVKGFLVSKALLKGDSSTTSQPLRHLRGDSVCVCFVFFFSFFFLCKVNNSHTLGTWV